MLAPIRLRPTMPSFIDSSLIESKARKGPSSRDEKH